MAKEKTSFVLYTDLFSTVKKLPNDKAGELFKLILSYVNDESPITDDLLLQVAFEPIKLQLKRDLKKYEKKKKQWSDAGKKSAEKRSTKLTNVEQPLKTVEKKERMSTVTDNVTDNVTVKVNNIEDRKLKFANTLKPFLELYGKDLLNDFYKYWTEPNKSNSKFKQELLKTWSLDRRLETWAKNDKNFNNGKSKQSTTIADRNDELRGFKAKIAEFRDNNANSLRSTGKEHIQLGS